MRFTFLFLFLSLLSYNKIEGQFGAQIELGPSLYSVPQDIPDYQIDNTVHYGLGPSYWFRLKHRRVEFSPTFLVLYNEANSISNAISLQEIQFKLAIPIHFYPMDFNDDCNCPTFNKQGQFFKKGFHFILNPAFMQSNQQYKTNSGKVKNSEYAFVLGAGAGIDVGLNKSWTFSPSIQISKSFNEPFLLNPEPEPSKTLNVQRWSAELGLRFLWYARNRRY